jgi:integrase
MPKLSKADVPPIRDAEIRDALNKETDAETRALIALLYLLGVRISEALSLHREAFSTDNTYLWVQVPVLKAGQEGKDFPRRLYVKLENEFVEPITSHVNSVQTEQKVFSFNRSTAWRKIKKHFPNHWPHYLRHTRATIFSDKGYSESKLMGWFGWRRADTARIYSRVSQKTIEGMGDAI